jgi:hypothetical protein
MNISNLNTDPTYLAYMKRVAGYLQTLPKSEQQEIQNEIKSHVYESLHRSPELSVDAVLQKFGEPDAYLPEWVVLKKMEVATRSFDPIRIFGALVLGVRSHSVHAVKYILFGLLYLFTITFGVLSILKVLFRSNTGLFIYQRGFAFGYTSNIAGAYEILGWWFIPICLFVTIMLYIIITLLLKTSLNK